MKGYTTLGVSDSCGLFCVTKFETEESMRLNGKEINRDYENLEQLLLEHQFELKYIAVECNGRIIPRSEYSDYIPQPEDEMEVVSFVGGG